MYLMQIFLPTRDNQGDSIPEEHFLALRDELTDRFGGVTIYTRAPVEGIWKPSENNAQVDQLVIYEVLLGSLEISYWKKVKSRLETSFMQAQIMMRYFNVVQID
ncbi:hypothetical protein LZD49_32645 [Dyadobacter sp. CY261]|uniref:hypothetical protein n=1 Tax=Dyadobacter sp. CY261 TaxID=2907203 RepID=UPI001F2F7A27|nr:hypothetical protein [Dyadobacter sp. CY261]MCF0075275.1 hypothetical protein [Dyadobacter sp. CY261]